MLRAVANGDLEMVLDLIAAGADVNAASHNGETALLRAAASGELEMVRALVAARANLNATLRNGETALVLVGNRMAIRRSCVT